MRLLLLLSAILAALTGAGGDARVRNAPAVAATSLAASRPASAAHATIVRAVAAPAGRLAVARLGGGLPPVLLPAPLLYAERRRE